MRPIDSPAFLHAFAKRQKFLSTSEGKAYLRNRMPAEQLSALTTLTLEKAEELEKTQSILGKNDVVFSLVSCPICRTTASFPFNPFDINANFEFSIARCHQCKKKYYAGDQIVAQSKKSCCSLPLIMGIVIVAIVIIAFLKR